MSVEAVAAVSTPSPTGQVLMGAHAATLLALENVVPATQFSQTVSIEAVAAVSTPCPTGQVLMGPPQHAKRSEGVKTALEEPSVHCSRPDPSLHPAPNAGGVVWVCPSYTLVYPCVAGGKSMAACEQKPPMKQL